MEISDFFKALMPPSRKADFYLGCCDSSVFIDFDKNQNNQVVLIRISFDGFGCCEIKNKNEALNHEDSQVFISEMENKNLNQTTISDLVKKLIIMNKNSIWKDAIEKYNLI